MTSKIGAGSGADALVCEPTPWSGLQKQTRASAAVPGDCPT
jgi:hypothetical protein